MISDENKNEIDITNIHNELDEWVERIGMTAKEICNDPDCNRIRLKSDYCNSEHIVIKAIRRNKQYDIQRYLCKQCGKRFSFNIGFEKMRAPAYAITSAMQLYFTGESFRNVMRFLELRGVHVSHVTA